MPWKCTVCTYEGNIDARTLCEMCGTERVSVGKPEVAELMTFGYSKDMVEKALSQHPDKDSALNWLLSNPSPMDASASGDSLIEAVSHLGFDRDTIETAIGYVGRDQDAVIDWIVNNQGSMDVDVEEKVEVIGADVDDDEARARVEQARKEEAERLARAEEIEKRLHEQRVHDIEEAARKREEEKKFQEVRHARERLQRMEALRAKEKLEMEQMKERLKGKEMVERSLNDIPSSIKELRKRYRHRKSEEVLRFIVKLLSNIVEHPENDQFRCLNSSSHLFDRLVLQHSGALSILECIGFEFQTESESNDKKYVLAHSEIPKAQEELEKLQRYLNRSRTNINETIESCMVDDNDSDALLFALSTIRELFDNIITNPTPLTRTISTTSEVFQHVLRPCPASLHILKSFGFERRAQRKDLFLENLDIQLLQNGMDDLKLEITSRITDSKIYSCLKKAFESNSSKKFIRVSSLLRDAFHNFLESPIEIRYHKLNMKKLFGSKFIGGLDLVRALGFAIEKVKLDSGETMVFVVFQDPFTKSLEWYKSCSVVFKKSCKLLLERN